VGEFQAGRRWHDEAIALAPENAEIAAARVADGLWLESDPQRLASIGNVWARRFAPSAEPCEWRQAKDKLTIGYIVSAFADSNDVAHIAALVRAHDRAHATVIGYGIGAQSRSQNLAFQGAFDLWQDISPLDSSALALFFERDGLDVVIDVAGFAAPINLLALARLRTAIRVAWIGNDGRVAAPLYDAQLVAASAGPAMTSAWQIAGGYPIGQVPAEPRNTMTGRPIQFGADVVMAQIDAETTRLWSEVLQRQPDAKLLLRAHDMTSRTSADRLVAAFGRDFAGRIDIVTDEDVRDFYARVDVALTPCKGVSPRMAAEALVSGVVPVALGGSGVGKVHASFLEGIGLGSALVAPNQHDYAKHAVHLASSAAARKDVFATLSASGSASEEGVARFAAAIEHHARRVLATAKARAL
jgi:predicted O-linked N-acetylglucosamine transferase (SPINDLY family)